MTFTARRIEASEPGAIARVPAPRARAADAIPLGWLLAAAAIGCAGLRMLLVQAGLSLALGPRPLETVSALALVAAVALWMVRDADDGWQRTAREIVTHASLFTLFCLTGAIAAYPIAAAGGGYVDAALVRADAALGFHWIDWYRFVAARPWAQAAGRTAYLSIFVTPAVLIVHFALVRRTQEARRFLAAFWVAAVATLAIARALPVRGPLCALGDGPLPYVPASGRFQADLPPQLRLHELRDIDPMALHGLVGAPSFHTASAVLYIMVGWRSQPLRWPLLGLNAAMLLATPVEGTHYLVDMLMGAGVALAALAAVDAIIRLRRARPHSVWPAPSRP